MENTQDLYIPKTGKVSKVNDLIYRLVLDSGFSIFFDEWGTIIGPKNILPENLAQYAHQYNIQSKDHVFK